MIASPSVSLKKIEYSLLENAIQIIQTEVVYDLEIILAKYRPVITFKIMKSIGTQTPDWEDIANEILFQVIEKLKKGEFRGESSLGTFIYTITSRRVIDFIRKKTKILKHAPEPSSFLSPEDEIEKKQRKEALESCLRRLKPKYRDILDLYYFRDLTRTEVAELLNISPRRVSERVNYAQKLLRKEMTAASA